MLHKKYLQDFKSAAIRELESGKSVNELARALGVNAKTLNRWYSRRSSSGPAVVELENIASEAQ